MKVDNVIPESNGDIDEEKSEDEKESHDDAESASNQHDSSIAMGATQGGGRDSNM